MTQEAGTPPGFWDRVEQIAERVVARYARSGPLQNASISDGGLTIKGGFLKALYPASLGGSLGVYFGHILNATTQAYLGTGLLIQAPDGKDVATFRSDAATGTTLVVLRDPAENAVLYTDTVSGEGLGRPWLSGGFYLSRNSDWPTVTSGTFETVYRARTTKQHAKLLVQVWGFSDTAGATGEIRVMVNGTQIGTTATTTNAGVAQSLFYGGVSGTFGSTLVVEVQARVATGAGAVQLCPSEMTSRN